MTRVLAEPVTAGQYRAEKVRGKVEFSCAGGGIGDSCCESETQVVICKFMNSLDRKLATVFKAALKKPKDDSRVEKVSKEFNKILKQIVSQDLLRSIERVFSEISCPPNEQRKLEAAEALGLLRGLLDRGFKKSAATVFSAWLDSFSGLKLEQILPIAPTATCFDKWIKAAKASAQEVEKNLLAQPNQTYATVGADWLLGHSKPEAALPLFELFLARQPRPEYLLPWNEALVVALEKDKRGNLLDVVLKHQWPGEESIVALAEAVRSDRSALRMTVDFLPMIFMRKDANPSGVSFINEIFRETITSDGADRELMTALLARLGTGILLAERKSSQSEAALVFIQKTNRQLRNLTREDTLQSRTWLFDNLCQDEEPADGRLHLTPEGLRHLAIAFAKAAQGFAAKDILILTARNLGLSSIGKKGEMVSYNPLIHEDVEGGLVPGYSVVIEESGWGVKQEAVVRAKVKRAQGSGHV